MERIFYKKIGYVANSPYTVLGECISAGRLYDRINEKASAKVVMLTEKGVICRVSEKSLKDKQEKR